MDSCNICRPTMFKHVLKVFQYVFVFLLYLLLYSCVSLSKKHTLTNYPYMLNFQPVNSDLMPFRRLQLKRGSFWYGHHPKMNKWFLIGVHGLKSRQIFAKYQRMSFLSRNMWKIDNMLENKTQQNNFVVEANL